MSSTSALLSWASSCLGKELSSPADCADGVDVANLLSRVDQSHFTKKWLSTVKQGVPAENVRLKSSNVKKVLAAITEYYADVLGLSLDDGFRRPDANKVAEGDEEDTGEGREGGR